TLVPCVYDDFFATAKRFMADENREQLRKLLGFRFRRHVRYNLPPKRLKLMEEQVRKRAMRLLEN
ncbi:MAG: XRE family transcriptional regulator, partial [Christensenellales bacterium]